MQNLEKWKILNSKLVLNHQWCQVRQDQVELPNGVEIDDYFVNLRPEIALVLPITSNQEIVLVRQYRHGVGEILLELPAGAFNLEQESPQTAALRELEEETGYTTDQITQIAILYDNPVKDNNKIYLFVAENATKSRQQQLDLTEEIEVVLLPLSGVIEKIMAGEICVSGTVAAIFLGLKFLNDR